MKNLNLIVLMSILIFMMSACQTVKKRTDEILEKENKKLEKYIGKPSKILKRDLGRPDEDYKNLNGNLELIYKTKKYGITCERKFEIDPNSIIVGFVSKGCF